MRNRIMLERNIFGVMNSVYWVALNDVQSWRVNGNLICGALLSEQEKSLAPTCKVWVTRLGLEQLIGLAVFGGSSYRVNGLITG